MLATYLLAQRYTNEPQIAALAVIFITGVSFTIGAFIVNGFNRIVESHRLKSQFISLASHQLRAPLSVLKWTLETGQSDYQTYSPQDLGNFIATLGTATENMIKTVDTLLDMNRIEAGTLVLHRESLAPGELVHKALGHFQASLSASPIAAQAAKVTTNLVIPDGLPNVRGDANRVIAILLRLIDNAVRYTPNGGLVIIRLAKTAGFVTFSVKDSGIGIPQQDQGRVFEKFFRSAGALHLQTEGAGTGLYIGRAVIEALGGTMSFTSQEGKGSQFSFTLPIDQEVIV
jgi:signal transduction histidine kinase